MFCEVMKVLSQNFDVNNYNFNEHNRKEGFRIDL